MSEMVERVARGMCLEAGLDPDWAGYADGKTAWQIHAPLARAAIAAMREPTEAMILAGYNEIDAYQRMIDAALA